MRFWIPILIVALASCMGPSCQLFDDDPCPGHAGNGCTKSDCDCPAASQVTQRLQGTACTTEGTVCAAGDIFSFSCRCAGGEWYCNLDLAPAPDLTAPPKDLSEMPQDFSLPDEPFDLAEDASD